MLRDTVNRSAAFTPAHPLFIPPPSHLSLALLLFIARIFLILLSIPYESKVKFVHVAYFYLQA